MANIIEDIYGVYTSALADCAPGPYTRVNSVIIPESRRPEVEQIILTPGVLNVGPFNSLRIFGCKVLFSADTDVIKAGYLR